MYLTPNTVQRERGGFPRTRGDVPEKDATVAVRYGLPPHTRGCTESAAHQRVLHRASPAHAGMYRCRRRSATGRSSFPRTRGDVPSIRAAVRYIETLPPHTRGCTSATLRFRTSPGASPAHAGMYPRAAPRSPTGRSFPRTRGDVPAHTDAYHRILSLPPHTRGCTVYSDRAGDGPAASPAHAGMYLRRRR